MTARPDVPDDDAETVSSFGRGLSMFSTAGTFVLAGSVLAYGLGWRAANSYYGVFGAAWITTDLRLMELLSFLGLWGIFVVGLTIANVAQLADGTYTEKIVNRRALVWALIGVVCYGAGEFDYFDSHELLKSALYIAGAWIWGIAIAGDVSTLAVSIGRSHFKWRSGHLKILHYVTLVALYYAPHMWGVGQGLWDRSVAINALPMVILTDGSRWRLLRTNGDNLVLSNTDVANPYPTVKFIKATDAQLIQKVP